jgi:Ni,Fe-hydrogenase III small subunit
MRAYKPEPVEEMGQVLAEALEGMPKPSAVARAGACGLSQFSALYVEPLQQGTVQGATYVGIQDWRVIVALSVAGPAANVSSRVLERLADLLESVGF